MIIKMSRSDYKLVASMAQKLWPTADLKELENSFLEVLDSKHEVCLVVYESDSALGFAHLSTRSDYVEGCDTSPVAYIEGIYVEEASRRSGISKELIRASEEWAKSMGYKELASDCELNNSKSIKFHLGVGFEEMNRIVCFKKTL